MKVATLTTLVALTGLAAAQLSKIPTCALPCFEKAITKTSCGLNTYCQCTTGAKVIQSAVIECLCSTNACTTAELKQLQDASNVACSSALAASSKTYSPQTIPASVCKAGSTATGSTNSTMSTTGTGTGTGTGTAAAAASSSAASSSSGTGAAPTSAAALHYELCAGAALAGLALLGL